MLEVLREVGEEFAGRRGDLRLASWTAENDKGPAVAGPVKCAEEDSNLHPVIPD